MKNRLSGLLMLSAVLALAPVLSGQVRTPTPVSSQLQAGRRLVTATGALVTLIQDVKVPATEMGMLTALPVTEGQQIEVDMLLAEIDNRETLAKQKIAQGEYDAASATAESTAEIEVAQKAVEVSKAELDSNQEINAKNPGAVSQTELRKFRFQYERALAQVKLALTDQTVAKETAIGKKAQLEAIDIELDRRQIKAPFKGEVVEVFKKRGEWVQAGEPVMHVMRLDKLKVKGWIRANDASPAEVIGKPVAIVVDTAGQKQQTVRGVIGYASPVVEGSDNYAMFRVWAEIDNMQEEGSWAIQPGSTATMTIDLAGPRTLPAVRAESSSRASAFKPVISDVSTKAEPTDAAKHETRAVDPASATEPAVGEAPADGNEADPKPALPAPRSPTAREL